MVRTALVLLLLLVPLAAAAQEAPIRWGRITDAEVALDSVAGDPDASAVVLGDVGFAEVRLSSSQEDFEFRVRRHQRVKVFKEAGYKLGEYAIRFSESSDVRGIKGQTFVPEPGGGMRRVELEGRSIVEDEVSDGVREVRFSMPALAPGAIFEVEYTLDSENILVPPVWYFQSSEPTLVSEYRFEIPEFFGYVHYTQGVVETAAPKGVRARNWEAAEHRWTARDVPALREEPYMTTPEDYVAKIETQLSQTSFPGQPVRPVLSSWAKVAEELTDHGEFGRRLRRNRRVEALAGTASGTDADKARALYDLVRTGYVWNEEGGIFADRDLDAVVEARGGSAAELNLLLLALLREADVKATPVLVSTRQNGRPLQQYPILSQFDHVLVLVEPEGGELALLDATDPHQPYGRLPADALSGQGWLADPARPEWFSFDPPSDTATLTMVRGALHDDGRVDGTLTLRLNGYDARNLRARLAREAADAPAAAAAEAAEEAAAEAADAADAVDIETVLVKNLDDVYAPVDVESTFSTAAGDVVGDEIYLTPFVVMRLDENPFERPSRAFAVDFPYPFTRTYVAEIALPEGAEVADLPAPVSMTIPSGAVSYQRMIGTIPGAVQLRAVLRVAQAQVRPEEYGALRQLYDEIVATESEALVVARAAAPAAPAEADAAEEPATSGDGSDQ